MRGLVLLLACLWSIRAYAEPSPDVAAGRRHFERARAFVRLGDHRSAIREFEAAYQADPRPNLLFNIAQQHRILAQTGALDELRSAVSFFDRYLQEKPAADDRRQVEEYIADLKSRIVAAEGASVGASARPTRDATDLALPSHDANSGRGLTTNAPDGASSSRRRFPGWGWALIGAGSLVVIGGAVALGLWLAPADTPPATSLGGFGAN